MADAQFTDAHLDAEGSLHALGIAVGDVVAGKYRVERLLGRGRMGVVVAATHLALGELVAIKLLAADAPGKSSAVRFNREARAAARIRSEHVVRATDVGVLEAGAPFIVMEHLEGMSLADGIRTRGAFPIEEIVQLAIEICDALAAAHALGIVHRDLKPSNLFLARQLDGSSIIKVLDFGISRVPDGDAETARLTVASQILGSPHYMSPEQIQNPRDVDARADIWSLGVIVYELLAGVRPFEAGSRADLFEQISLSQPKSLRDLRPETPPELEAIVMDCLQHDLSRRIRHVAEVARRLCDLGLGGPRAPLLVERVRRIFSSQREAGAPAVEERSDSQVSGAGTRNESEDGAHTASAGTMDAANWDTSSQGDESIVRTVQGRSIRLRKVLGEGGMGIVYEAEDDTNGPVAVKIIRPEAARNPMARERLIREAEAAMRVRSEHVVGIREVAMDERTGAPFIVMDLFEGEDLSALVQRLGPLDPSVVARIFVQVCRGLADAHRSGLVHRDIKPANLFLHRGPNRTITVRICDFGIAKCLETDALQTSAQGLTGTGTALGSPLYMSPEQVKNARDVDIRTDIWSVCLAMYESISGEHPWARLGSAAELILAICTQDIPPLHKTAPWLDRRFADVIQRGLRRDSVERWRDAEELEAALLPFANREGTLGEEMLQGLGPERARQQHRRSMGRTAKIALGGVAIMVGLLVVWVIGHASENPLNNAATSARMSRAVTTVAPELSVAPEASMVPMPPQPGVVSSPGTTRSVVSAAASMLPPPVPRRAMEHLKTSGGTPPARSAVATASAATPPPPPSSSSAPPRKKRTID